MPRLRKEHDTATLERARVGTMWERLNGADAEVRAGRPDPIPAPLPPPLEGSLRWLLDARRLAQSAYEPPTTADLQAWVASAGHLERLCEAAIVAARGYLAAVSAVEDAAFRYGEAARWLGLSDGMSRPFAALPTLRDPGPWLEFNSPLQTFRMAYHAALDHTDPAALIAAAKTREPQAASK